jgi:polysaccharide biosynthesis/export protein
MSVVFQVRKWLHVLVVICFAAVICYAQEPVPAAPGTVQPTPASTVTTTAAAQAANDAASTLRIAAGDLVQISVYGVDDMRRDVRVSSGGEVTLPLLGAIRIAGMTAEESETLIGSRLKQAGVVKDPQVSVFVKEFATQGVSVMGEVMKPGIYPVLGPRRLFDLIAAASGMSPKAGRLVRVIHRGEPDKPVEVSLAGDPARSPESNIEIFPGDTILVSKAGIVYVVGDVKKPGGFVMDQNVRLTVFQAIALAEGTNTTASLNSAKLVRRGPSGVQEIPLQLSKVFALKAPDVQLEADDIVYVPTSTGKRAARRGLETILQTVSGVLIYHP